MSCGCDFSCLAAPAFSFECGWAEGAGAEGTRCPDHPQQGACSTRGRWCLRKHRALACCLPLAEQAGSNGYSCHFVWFCCFSSWGGGGGGARESCQFVNLSAKETWVFGCRPLAAGNCGGCPAAGQRRGVACLYMYISISLYIYAFFFLPSLSSVTVCAAGTWVLHWRIQSEGPFLTVLWLGLDWECHHLLTEVRIPVASCPFPLGTGLFLCTPQLWSPACQDAAVWPP